MEVPKFLTPHTPCAPMSDDTAEPWHKCTAYRRLTALYWGIWKSAREDLTATASLCTQQTNGNALNQQLHSSQTS